MKHRLLTLGLLALSLSTAQLLPFTQLPASAQTAPAAGKSMRIVILPFKNITHAAADDWLSDSFAESLTMGLLKLDALQLVERSQIGNVLKEQQFGQSAYVDESTAPQVGKLLGAQVVVLGSYQKVGEQLQANVRFVDVATGQIDGKRSAQVTGTFTQIFDLQKQLATNLIDSLQVQAKPDELAKLDQTLKATESPEAYKLYMSGIEAMRTDDSQHLDKARDAFRQALDIDAKYTLSLAGLAEVHARKAGELSRLAVQPPNLQMGVRGPDDLGLAKQYARQAAELDANLPEVLRAQAWVARAQGDFDAALALMEKAVKANPRDSRTVADYFGFRFENGKLDKISLTQLQQEMTDLGANLDDPWVEFTLATFAMASEALKATPRVELIRALLEKAQKGLPSTPSIPLTLYSVAKLEGKPSEAEGYFQQALTLSANSPDILASMAVIRLGENRPQDAQSLIQKAEALYPQGNFVRLTKAQILYAGGHKPEANALYAALEKDLPQEPMLAFSRGVNAIVYDHDDKAAKAYFEIALERSNNKPGGVSRSMLKFFLGNEELALGELGAARKYFESLLSDPLFYAQAYQSLATVYYAQQDYSAALKAYTAYITIQPENSESPRVQRTYRYYYLLDQNAKDAKNAAVLNDLGLLAQQREEDSKAITFWQQALTLEPANPVVLYNFGSFYLETDTKQAAGLLEKAVAAKPDYTKAWFNLGRAKLKLNDKAGAKAAFEKVLSLEPGNQEARQALSGL